MVMGKYHESYLNENDCKLFTSLTRNNALKLNKRGDRFMCVFLVLSAFSCYSEGADVVLERITIFDKHELLGKPSVYFRCKGEGRKSLPDVTHKNRMYSYLGHESFQPLTVLEGERCKRCGFYESDTIKRDDVFDEWELCPLNFAAGRYTHYRPKQLNVTFLCGLCNPSAASPGPSHSAPGNGTSGVSEAAVERDLIVLAAVGSAAAIVFLVSCVLMWRKLRWWPFRRSKYEDTARFMQLFDEEDDMDDDPADNQL